MPDNTFTRAADATRHIRDYSSDGLRPGLVRAVLEAAKSGVDDPAIREQMNRHAANGVTDWSDLVPAFLDAILHQEKPSVD